LRESDFLRDDACGDDIAGFAGVGVKGLAIADF